jgi:hypothetical protein
MPQIGAVAGLGWAATGWAGSTAGPHRTDGPLLATALDAQDPDAHERRQQHSLGHSLGSRQPTLGQPGRQHRE